MKKILVLLVKLDILGVSVLLTGKYSVNINDGNSIEKGSIRYTGNIGDTGNDGKNGIDTWSKL